MDHWPYPYKTLDGSGFGSGGGTVTSVSASVPSWLSVSVTNPTTTPNIVISGSATGSGITVLQDAPTLINVVTMTGHLDITRNSGSGEAITISNSHSGLQDNYIAVSKNSSPGNHAHFGHHYVNSNDPGNYAYIQTKGNQFIFTGDAKFQLPTTLGSNGQALITNGAGITSWTSLTTGTVTSVSASVPAFLSVNVSNSTTTPAIAITLSGSALPTTSGGTGLTSIGTNGQVLTSNGTSLTWTTPTTGTVTSVNGSSPINSSGGNTPTISLSTVPTTLGGTGLTTVGSNGQVLTSNGTSLSWTTPTSGTLTAVTASSPLSSSGGSTPNIALSTVPTTLGGTGLTTVGANGQVLQSNGTALQYVTLPTPVTSVSATTPISSTGGATPTISLSTVPTTLGGTGLTTVGTNGQVLTSNGTTLTWTTPTTGTVTSVSATSPLASTGGVTPTISISSSTGSGAVVLQTTPTLLGNVGIGYSGGTSKLSIGDGTIDAGRYGSVQITQDFSTIINTPNIVAAIACVSSGNYTWGLGYAQGTNTFGFGTGVASGFSPSKFCITPSGAIGIGNTSPAYEFDINLGGVPRFAVRSGNNAGWRTEWDYSGGVGETTIFNYKGSGSGGFYFKNLNTSNVDTGYAYITCGGLLADINGEAIIIRGTDHGYLRYVINGSNRGFVGFSSPGGADLVIYNQYTSGGHILLNSADTNGLIRCVKPIFLEETMTLRPAVGSSNYVWRFPTSMGTSGQVLTTDGTNTYWGSGGGGGGGTVNSVTASAPLASSGGTAPNISIASATGSGSVVLQTTPLLLGNVNVGYAGGSSKLNIGDGSLDTARYGSVQISQDSSTIINTASNVAALSFVRTGNYVHGLGYKQSSSTFGFGQAVLSGFNPNFLAITTNGDIGINTSSPGCKFDVLTTLGNTAARFKGTPEALILDGTNHVFMRFAQAGVNKAYLGYGNAGDTNFDISNAVGHISMYPTGNVGIGSTSPAAKLDVNGTFACKSDAIIAASAAGQGHLQLSSTGNANYIRFGLDGTSGSYAPLIFTSSAGYIEWMRITADGKIGINKYNPAQALDVGGIIQTAYGNGGIVQFWDSNFAIYGRRSYSDSILGPYGDKLSFYSYGGHEWFGGNQPIATQVQLMTLTAGGSLGIGTSTPAYRLDVSTTSNATTKFAVHNGYNAGFTYSWNDSGATGESNFYNYKGAGFGGFSFQNKNTSNAITDYANIDCGSVYARNYFTTNGVNNFTYSEVNFTPIMLVYNGSSGSYGPIVYNAAGYMNFLTYTIQTGRISRIGRIVTVSVDISYNYQWVPFGPTSGANQIAILLPGACRTTALSASGAAGYPNNLAGIANPIAMWLGNCSYDAGSGQTENAYIAPTSGTSFIAWNTSSTFINQRLFWSVSYNVT